MRRRRIGWMLLLAVSMGCAMQPVHRQSFVALTTPHFEILSSLGEQPTRRLAGHLELFHAGVVAALGVGPARVAPERARVLAFDDRSFSRPFARRDEKLRLVERLASPFIVLRTPDGWNERDTRQMAERYAHRVLRQRTPERPLWYEEGLAQFASAQEIRPPYARFGGPIPEHVERLRERPASSLDALLTTSDLTNLTATARKRFESRSWGLVRMLVLRDARDEGPSALERFARAFDAGEVAPETALGGSGRALARDLAQHIGAPETLRLNARPEIAPASSYGPPAPVPQDRALVALAELAIAMGEAKLANDLFERALAIDASNADAHMGRARVGDASGSEGAAARALALAPEDARIRFLAGELALRRAGAVQGLARQGLIERGRRHFRASLSIDRVNPDARLGMARSYALDGENAARGLEWIGTLRTLRTGSLEVDLVAARLHARAGAPDRASRLVARVASRTHSPRLAERALGIRDARSR